ncbi:MAG: 4Fe-4S binding protein [Desulfarculaceae bacterium]|nr:4Fe-4S binding protein [Desulfarculaceae bacterium]MCF8071570.1 4Fe-4S binding protein [Desulfarculaceae bacterium]MCF8102385.1 4Fe-4S binding protein [Desulfarculaceae bacterium]MCF8114849.1 4Fe-4S binding protein [Desulfarculaceae bacterium]
MSILSLDQPGRQLLYMGNEAIARGAIEAGVRVVASYPGNPSSEITASLAKVAGELGMYVEWSVNEKVAAEVAAGASLAGLRSMTCMKHNGLNVASDFLFALNFTGTKGGMVIVICDDPLALSSTAEQDTRAFAKAADLPLLEPSDFQEGKDMVKAAFRVSEEVGLPVLVHSVTRFSHARGNVTLGEIPQGQPKPHFDTLHPAYPKPVENTHPALHRKLAQAGRALAGEGYNSYSGPERPDLLVLTCGSGVAYMNEALEGLGASNRVGVAKLGLTWPLPEGFLRKTLARCAQVLFFEEIDPFLEDNVKAFCAQEGGDLLNKTFLGKASGAVPSVGENSPDTAVAALGAALGLKPQPPRPADYADEALALVRDLAPVRQLGLCAGCPHRATYWAVKNALALDGREGFVTGDIGCYAQGRGPSGFSQMKTMFAMGSGAGIANGFGQLTRFGAEQPVLAVCGDSTFFHAALPALINARFNGSNLLMLILDNNATAMTGFQPHPGVGITAMGQPAPALDPAEVCRSLGAEVLELDPFEVQKTTETIYDLLQDLDGVKILVLKQECALVRGKRQRLLFKMSLDQERCLGADCGCNRFCTRVFKCPGLIWDPAQGKAAIDEAICTGCGVCATICPQQAIVKEVIS